MSSLMLSLREDAVPAYAAATHQARQMFGRDSNSSRRSSSGKEESESAAVFDEFGAFEQADGEELLHVIERQHEEYESEEEDEEKLEEGARRLREKMRSAAVPTQKNSPGMRAEVMSPFKQAALRKKEEPVQKASPKAVPAAESSKAVGNSKEIAAESEHGHTRAATDPMSSAAVARMRYYRKLIPAPKPKNTSPKSQPHVANHLSNTAENRRFFPPSQSAVDVLYHSNRSLPIMIPSKKASPTNDDSHRFRAEIHPRIAADSSFILPAASFLPSALHKSFVPDDSEDEEGNSRAPGKHRDSLKDMKTDHLSFEKDDQFGFEFDFDM